MKKYFYLKDHLGNIRVTVDENGDVEGYNDYYPFGLQMPGRSMNNALATDMYKYSSKELDEEGLTGYTPFSVRVISKGYLDGNAAAIYVNDSYISGSGLYARGYTIVVVDENGTVVDKAHFDTYSSTAEADAMADFINNVATGHYVIGVIKDDGSQSMTENAYNALASVGCQHSREVGFRYSYAFIGKKGESSCGYEAYAPAGQGFVDKRIGELQPLALYYFGARYYDPAIGRWLSVDPLEEKYPGISPYVFTLNNPIKYYDPDGKQVRTETLPYYEKYKNNLNQPMPIQLRNFYKKFYTLTFDIGAMIAFPSSRVLSSEFSFAGAMFNFFTSNNSTDNIISFSTFIIGLPIKKSIPAYSIFAFQLAYDLKIIDLNFKVSNNKNNFSDGTVKQDNTKVVIDWNSYIKNKLGIYYSSPYELWQEVQEKEKKEQNEKKEKNND
ncbi:RHS repeat-associated core domain-containing protein [Caldithrix abyssi DSM 13497]|uniref:RHS repeat-associated core domain-containing protein n=1 Tax=Caldithrix abyssi DSM 13497 TaxID=880073 RepID=H1XVW4_CALAY|nr:interleukin-like EMT inducer domain-containing protein [Caldithrix abyssi]APF20832.1 RHS repeat-associated core domain-containing protein [Caldithrix abyssi DSM 13497]EHO40691.1 RHS repeat-associated core domain-containing protein [Caldithrix abyssi DSM 13497]